MSARLHVLLGSGGVGKTTLAAGYALALARTGRKVGLLGIDPARRLQSALGLTLLDLEAPVPGHATLSAALFRPPECLRRWAKEACSDDAARARLESNAFFLAMADRLAGATDILAAARMAEWTERDPALTDLIVDTAPGLNAIEFLQRPGSLLTFLEGRLVKALRWLAQHRSGRFGSLVRSGTAALGGLARVGGTRMLFELADFLLLVEPVLVRMLERLEAAQAWLQRADTEVLLVSAVRPDAESTTQQLTAALKGVGVQPAAIVLNRALAPELITELATTDPSTLSAEERDLVRFISGTAAVQTKLHEVLRARGTPVKLVPAARGLDGEARLDALAALGASLVS
ncbi:MAG: ArsA-related P-loop ATPase [Myxococcota bacterium]